MSKKSKIVREIYDEHYDNLISIAEELVRLKQLALKEDNVSRAELAPMLIELENDIRLLSVNLDKGRTTLGMLAQ